MMLALRQRRALGTSSEWDGVAYGAVRWLYSDERQAYEAKAIDDLARLLSLPSRRVVVQGSEVRASAQQVVLYAWILRLQEHVRHTSRSLPQICR